MKEKLTQADYTAYEPGYQLKLPMETEIFIPKDSPVRLLNAVVENSIRGTVKVEVEWALLSLAYNVLKLHHKLKSNRLGTGLVIPKGFPAGL